MPLVLICSREPEIEAELAPTVAARAGAERRVATSFDDALALAHTTRPDVVLIDRDLPEGVRLVAALRGDAATRDLSIAVVARGDFDAAEVDYLEMGANAVLRLPPDAEWDQRLGRLLGIPVRRDVRLQLVVGLESAPAGAAPATALNLSVRGLLLDTRASLQVGEAVDVVLRLPDGEDALSVRGRVVREAGGGRYGIEFESLDDGTAERIRRFFLTPPGTAVSL
ncbi:MAG TPA: PilZ domain-containing protein [Vicinamibacteria bacterium]|jgi:CheY-like chemotaxis protein